MIPILFEKTELSFTSNGLGRLAGCSRCVVIEERNGIFECEFDVPVSSAIFDEVQIGRIIGCTHDEKGDIQPFDIYAKSEPINGIVTFRAHHISYRLNEITVKPFTAGSCVDALSKINTQSVVANPFTFWTNKSVTANYSSDVPRNARAMLAGEENSILDVFGTGEYEFSRFEVRLHTHRGQDTNASIRYGKNLRDFENERDISDSYTAAVPYWIGDETVGDESVTTLVTLPEWYIESGYIVPSGREVFRPMDLSSDFEEKPTVEELRTKATARLQASDAWLPTQTIKVDFVQLWQTEEYADFAPLQRLSLCDTCGVFVPMYNISVRAKIIRVVWNVLLDRYDEMELGDKPTSYSAVLEKSYNSKVASVAAGLRSIGVKIDTVEQKAKTYTDGVASELRDELEDQIDAKIETWAQSTNPATNWTTTALRTEHNNDLWLYTGTSNITVGSVTIKPQGVYKYNGSTNTWSAYSSTATNLFDLVDGKSTIFYGSTSGTYQNVQTGDYLVDSSTGATYRWSGSAWQKQTDYKTYTDDAVSSAKTTIESEYEQAIADATAQITGGTGGYVITTLNANNQPIELLITDNIDINQAVNVWRWNQGGLGHSHSGYNGPFDDVAITQDGKINASMITTGILNANVIRAGVIQDETFDNYWDLGAGDFVTKKGKIGEFTLEKGKLTNTRDSSFFEIKYNSVSTGEILSGAKKLAQLTEARIYLRGATGSPSDLDWGSLPIGGWIEYNPYGDYFLLSHYGNPASINMTSNGDIVIYGTEVFVQTDFSVSGTKSRRTKTDNYSDRRLYCYETPTPLFGDIGEAVLDEEGLCYVDIDDIFTETIADKTEYQVFLQKEGQGDCWIAEKGPKYFVIQGTPGLKVAWELKAKQRDYENIRLEQVDYGLEEYEHASDNDNILSEYINEMEELLYGND